MQNSAIAYLLEKWPFCNRSLFYIGLDV
jgi:hypothetical protein